MDLAWLHGVVIPLASDLVFTYGLGSGKSDVGRMYGSKGEWI